MKNSVCIALLSILIISISAISNPVRSQSIELKFVDHLKAGLIEQDVYIEKEKGSGLVYRILPGEEKIYGNYQLFSSAEEIKHDPFDKTKSGPYKKGIDLNMTLKDWLDASGSASYKCQGGWGTLKANFRNLKPNSVYTYWHIFLPSPPTEPFTGSLNIPLGERDGSQSVFKTDMEGSVDIEIRFERCLELGENQLMTGIAIAYHSDGKTYAASPGPFGYATHVHLFARLPNKRELITN